MTRADLLLYVQSKFASLITDNELATTDTASGLKFILDAAFLQLGTAYTSLASATVTTGSELAAQALADYFAYDYFLALMIERVDVAYDESTTQRRESQSVLALLKQKELALQRCRDFGYLKRTLQAGRFNLDYLEAVEE